MLQDAVGSLWGALVFALALLAPGYCAGWWLDLKGFRERSQQEQVAWGLVLSVGAGTLPLVAVTWLAGLAVAEALLVAAGMVAAVLFLRARRPSAPSAGACLGVAAFAALVIFSLIDVGIDSRLWMSVTTYDHSVRVPFVDAVMRTGVVPVNPLYWPGHDAPLRYYYFWYVTCGVVAKLAHISARQALVASCVWSPLALVAALALYGKYLLGWRGVVLRSRTRLAVAFTAITGLDLLVAVINRLAGGAQNGDMEWWSVDQVASWADTFLWVPHHVAGLICCLLSFLLFWTAREERSASRRAVFGALAGLSFASAFGLSTFIAIAFCLVMALWVIRVLMTTRDLRQLAAVVVAVPVAAIVLTPYVLQLLHKTPAESIGATHGPRILSVQVRQMLVPGGLASAHFVERLAAHKPWLQEQIAALLLLLPGYAIEFGFFALVLWRFMRLRDKTEGERTVLFLTFAALLSVTFLRSTVITTNDYGIRATLLAQFFLLLLAVRVWEESLRGRRLFLRCLAAIGIAGSVYQAVTLRIFLPRQQMRGNLHMRELADREYALRDAYADFDRRAPRDARLQYNAPATGYFDYTHTLNAGRQIVAAGTTGNDCNTGFGGEVSACAAIRSLGAQLYAPTQPLSSVAAGALCRDLGAQYLVATRWDAIWQQSQAWPWTLPPVTATPSVRIVACSHLQGVPPA